MNGLAAVAQDENWAVQWPPRLPAFADPAGASAHQIQPKTAKRSA